MKAAHIFPDDLTSGRNEQIWREISELPDQDTEKGHTKGIFLIEHDFLSHVCTGECSHDCRICKGFQQIEESAQMYLLGATALEDRLQDLVPEAIQDMLDASIKVFMMTGDK